MRPTSRDGFKVAIICALTLEADAVEAQFDETYDKFGQVYGKQFGDQNTYITGRIGQHNVVLCYLPRMGIQTAASAAANLRVSYPQIALALVVGVCGAVPFPSQGVEIILGDLILSDSLIQYDFGRQYPDQFRRKTDSKETTGRPNQEVGAFLAGLKGRKTQIELQERLYRHLRVLQAQADPIWQYPGVEHDLLFEASYHHKHHRQNPGTECVGCLYCESNKDHVCDAAMQSDCKSLGCTGKQIHRQRHGVEPVKPAVCIGAIASANTVMKSGEERDRLASKEGVIGFEMEGAGVWDNMPCIIIKGVCDYADSHKNKTWQNYAAATASSGAKAFLEYWNPTPPETESAPLLIQELFGAIKRGNVPMVELLLGKVDVNARGPRDGRTALSIAAETGNCHMAKLLLKHGASVISRQYSRSCFDGMSWPDWNSGRTPLCWAASGGHRSMVELLLDHGASPDSANTAGRSVLHLACILGDQKMVKLLLDRGADVNLASLHHGWRAIHEVASYDHVNLMKVLLKYRPLLDVEDRTWGFNNKGKTPLHYATNNQSLVMMELLLSNGANPNVGMAEKITPLHLAAAAGWVEGIQLLLDWNATIDSEDQILFETPLHKAARNQAMEACQVLCERGANEKIQNIDGHDYRTVLALAREYPDDWKVDPTKAYFYT